MSEMNGDQVPVIRVPDAACEKIGVSLAWGGISDMIVYAAQKTELQHSEQTFSMPPGCENNIFYLRHKSVLFDSELRKLVNESSGTFTKSRNLPSNIDLRSHILDLSHEHRSSIRQCIENLQSAAINEKDEIYNEWADTFDNIELLWHLCELLHLDVVPADAVLPRLLEWVQFHSSEYDLKASAVLTQTHSKGAEVRHSDYWELVMRMLLQGRFQATRALLRLHSKADTSPFLEADSLLRSIPVYSVYCGLSVSEFNGRWKGWKSAVRTKIKSATFAAHPRLQVIMSILGEEELPIAEIKPYCETWYQLMTSVLLFTDPTVKIHDLNYHANKFINIYGSQSNLKLLDSTILAIFDSDISGTIRKLQMGIDGGWCAVHLGNLLDLSGYFSSNNQSNNNRKDQVQMEQLLLDYGKLLMSHHSLWQVGITYLEYCPLHGRSTLRLLLERVPIENERKAHRILNIARKLGLNDFGSSVCRVMGTDCMKKGETGRAVTWGLLSNDSEFASRIANHYLRCYSVNSELECAGTLVHLGQSILVSSRLTFLAKYCEFHELYEKGEIKEAAALLIRLLDSKVSPKYFWLTLLTDAIPLLTCEGTSFFNSDDTTVLLACLEELSTDTADNPSLKKPSFHEKTQYIRMAIAKNLAKTLISESCSMDSNERVFKCY